MDMSNNKKQPDQLLIDSMAMRYRHDFGILTFEEQQSIRVTMTQLWEEVVGLGFYKPKHKTMSNNKQSMKLYTEEQLTKYLLDEGIMELSDLANNLIPSIELPSDSLCINCDESKSTHNVCMDCMIKIGKENIELPSDEEIGEFINTFPYTKQLDDGQFNDGVIYGATIGIDWMRNKIQGGNK